jgi:hypothetical protein
MGAADKAAWTVLNSRGGVPPSAGIRPSTHAEAQRVLSNHLPQAKPASQYNQPVQGPWDYSRADTGLRVQRRLSRIRETLP